MCFLVNGKYIIDELLHYTKTITFPCVITDKQSTLGWCN